MKIPLHFGMACVIRLCLPPTRVLALESDQTEMSSPPLATDSITIQRQNRFFIQKRFPPDDPSKGHHNLSQKEWRHEAMENRGGRFLPQSHQLLGRV